MIIYSILKTYYLWYVNSLSIPPGTKVCLTGTITVQESFLMLDSKNTRVLGGEVEKLKEKWELNKVINYQHSAYIIQLSILFTIDFVAIEPSASNFVIDCGGKLKGISHSCDFFSDLSKTLSFDCQW